MGLRPEFRWLFYTALVVGVLLTISALALHRPNVVWLGGTPHCPECAQDVNAFSSKCRDCGAQYDWVIAPDEYSPISPYSLSPLEDDHLRGLVAKMGKEAAAANVATALSISPEAATAYLESVGRGRCGHCGGTGKDLATFGSGDEADCAVCFGAGACTACGGDRRMRVGDLDAARALEAYEANLKDIRSSLPVEVQRDEVRRLTRRFIEDHAGTRQAASAIFWPEWATSSSRSDSRAVVAARRRIDDVLQSLRTATSDN